MVKIYNFLDNNFSDMIFGFVYDIYHVITHIVNSLKNWIKMNLKPNVQVMDIGCVFADYLKDKLVLVVLDCSRVGLIRDDRW